MTKKKTTSSSPKFKFNGYVNISIPSSHDAKLKTYLKDADKIYLDMAKILTDGYSVKVTHDADKANFRCSVTGYESTGDNYGYVIGSFAGDWYTALGVALYKHFYIAKENWGTDVEDDNTAYG